MIRLILLTSAIYLGAVYIAYAGMPNSDWMTRAALTKQMEGQGYSGIEMKMGDEGWDGQAIKDGKIIEFHADPLTGIISKSDLRAKANP